MKPPDVTTTPLSRVPLPQVTPGVSVSTYAFHGIPDRFIDARQRVVEIDELEEIRRQLIVLLPEGLASHSPG